jgi:hypothetical protein
VVTPIALKESVTKPSVNLTSTRGGNSPTFLAAALRTEAVPGGLADFEATCPEAKEDTNIRTKSFFDRFLNIGIILTIPDDSGIVPDYFQHE